MHWGRTTGGADGRSGAAAKTRRQTASKEAGGLADKLANSRKDRSRGLRLQIGLIAMVPAIDSDRNKTQN